MIGVSCMWLLCIAWLAYLVRIAPVIDDEA